MPHAHDLVARVQEAAKELEVHVWVCLTTDDPLAGCVAQIDDGPAWVLLTAMPDTREGYLVAMHELGHMADEWQWQGLRLDRETRAWRWAVDHIPDLYSFDRRFIIERLYSYAANKRCRRTQAFEDLVLDLSQGSDGGMTGAIQLETLEEELLRRADEHGTTLAL